MMDSNNTGSDPLGLIKATQEAAKNDPMGLIKATQEATQKQPASQEPLLPGEGSYIYKPDDPNQPMSPQAQHWVAVDHAVHALSDIRSQKGEQAINNMTQDFLRNQIQSEVNKYAKPSSTSVKQQPSAAALQFPQSQSDTDPNSTRFPEIVNRALDPETGYAASVRQNEQNDPTGETQRQVLARIQKDNPDLAPQIQKNLYLLDSKDRGQNAPKILQNAQDIESGKLNYDVQKGQLTKPEDFWQSLATGFKQRNDVINDYNDYTTLDRKGLINKLEGKYANYDPDEPLPKPKDAVAYSGNMLGDQGPVMAEGTIAGAIGGFFAKNPAAAGWAAAAVTSPEFFARGFTASLEKNYFDNRRNGMSPDESVNDAYAKAQRDGALDVAQGAIMTAAGVKAGLTETPGAISELSPSYVNAATKILKKIPTFAKEVASEAGQVGAISAGIQGLKNINNGKPITEGMGEAALGQAAFVGVMGVLGKGMGALAGVGKDTYNALKRGAAEAPQPVIDEALGHLANTGQLTPEEANHAAIQIQDQKAANALFPKMSERTQQKIQDLINQRDGLQKQMDDPANEKYKSDFKDAISHVNEQIEGIKGAPPQDELIQRAQDEIGKGEIKGYSRPIYEEIAANHPEQIPEVLKEIAQQSYDPQSSSNATKIYGKGLVDIAQEMHPIETMPEYTSQINHVEPAEDAESIGQKPVSDIIEPDKSFRTINYGDYSKEGFPETPIAKYNISQDIEKGNVPLGETGETFDDFKNRVINPFKKALDSEEPNTTIVTHSSVLKAMKVWDDMGRPELNEMSPEQNKEFAQKYNDETVEPGALESFDKVKGDPNSGQIHVVRHGETEDNVSGRFRQDDTNLTQGGINEAQNAGGELLDKLKGEPVPKIIASDLPRAIHTANIIHDVVTGEKPNPKSVEVSNEEQPHLSADVLQGSYDRLKDQGDDPNSDQMKALKDQIDRLKSTPKEENEPRLVGISHEAQEERSKNELNVDPPERGEGVTLEQAIQRGRDLIKNGIKPQDVLDEFNKDGKVSADAMSVVRAEYERLAKETNYASDKYGLNSPEGKAAFDAERTWYNTAVKPMQTEWHKIGMTQQGKVDIDTGSITGMRRAFKEASGKDFTPEQEKTAKELSDKVNGLTAKVAEMQSKIDELMKKGGASTSGKPGIKQKGKVLANAIRGAKIHRPDMFSSATPASLAWDLGVEAVAKSVEGGAAIADAISKGIDAIKGTFWYKGLTEKDQQKAEKQFSDWHNEQANKKVALEDHFANKTDNKFTTEEAKAIWDYAKEKYIDKGTTDFHDIVNGVAKDIGLSPDQVRHAIATPKGAKEISDQMYKAMYDRRRAIQNAEIWVKSAGQPKVIKFFKSLPDFFFAAKTFGHGTVGGITHAGMNIFKPTSWNTYWPFFFEQFKSAFGGLTDAGTARYEKLIADHMADPDYLFWKRAGLAVDPTKSYDEYGDLKKFFGKFGEMGERGFSALKLYRLSQAKEIYSHLSDIEKSDPQSAREIAKIVNHSTGTTEVKVPSGFNVAFFAPKLEISRWQRFIQQPAKMVGTFANWKNASISDKVAAKLVARRSGEMVATYFAALAANQGILSLVGSKQKVNFINPTQSDWLKFKAGDKTIDVSGGMEATARFLATLVGIGHQAWIGDKNQRTKPQDKLYEKIGQQMRYKLSPFGSTAADLITGVDAMGRPLPFSSVKPPKGEDKYSLWSYLGEAQTPIPIAEGIQTAAEGMKEKGMSTPEITDVLNGIVTGVVSGGTGAHLNPDYSLTKKK